MLTMEQLRAFGADVDTGLSRCMGSEAFYLRMVGMLFGERNFDALERAVEADDLKAAFEAAHALKGVLGNLALTPLSEPVSELTEQLRSGTPGDYRPQVQAILAKLAELKSLNG